MTKKFTLNWVSRDSQERCWETLINCMNQQPAWLKIHKCKNLYLHTKIIFLCNNLFFECYVTSNPMSTYLMPCNFQWFRQVGNTYPCSRLLPTFSSECGKFKGSMSFIIWHDTPTLLIFRKCISPNLVDSNNLQTHCIEKKTFQGFSFCHACISPNDKVV